MASIGIRFGKNTTSIDQDLDLMVFVLWLTVLQATVREAKMDIDMR